MAGLTPTATASAASATRTTAPNQTPPATDGAPVAEQKETRGPDTTPDPTLVKPAVATTATVETAPVEAAAPQTDAQEAKALLNSAKKATMANPAPWLAANQIATANLKEFKAYRETASLKIPTPEVATAQLKTLADHFSNPEMAATLPITWQLHNAPEFKETEGKDARALVAEYGYDAVSREYVAALKTDPANEDPAALAAAILKNADRPVPQELLAGVPAAVRNGLGPQGLTFKNLCPELYVAAKKVQLSTVDPKTFATDAMHNSVQVQVDKPELQGQLVAAVQAAKAGLAQSQLQGQGQPPQVIDVRQAGSNFMTLMDYFSRSEDGVRQTPKGPVNVLGTSRLMPITVAGQAAQKALASGDNSVLAKVDKLGFDADNRIALQGWKKTSLDYRANGLPVYDDNDKEVGRRQPPPGYEGPVCFAYAVMDDPKARDQFPEAYGSAAQFLASFAVASQQAQQAADPTHGMNIAR